MRQHYILFAVLAFSLIAPPAFAHAIGGRDAAFVQATVGPDPFPFLYLGAKHMVTGYDHLLFLTGVIFFLYRLRDVLVYVTLFSLGHSTTLILGVLFDFGVSSHLVDMVIGLSVCWKAFDNLGGFHRLGWSPDNRIVVGGFGLIHGLGLATKLQDLGLNSQGLLENLIAFNVGVEIGQVIALSLILVAMTMWRTTKSLAASRSQPTHCFSSPALCWPASNSQATSSAETHDAPGTGNRTRHSQRVGQDAGPDHRRRRHWRRAHRARRDHAGGVQCRSAWPRQAHRHRPPVGA
ncbi:MAG: HupE/UreJ family protein [Hyphomonadaceae bacterium]